MALHDHTARVDCMRSAWKASMELTLDRLEDVQQRVLDGNPPGTGLCGAVGSRGAANVLKTCWGSWREYTGVPEYAVPAPEGFVVTDYPAATQCSSARGAYDATTDRDMYTGEYGAARMRLLEHCIAELKDRLSKPVTTLWGVWLGASVGDLREERAGFTHGKVYELSPWGLHGLVPRFEVLDDDSDTRRRSWDDFWVFQ